MANVIELVNKYLPILDEQYKLEAKSAILDVAPEFVQLTKDAKKIKIAKMRVDGLANYSRSGGFISGDTDLTWEEHEFTQDRGRALQIDAMDNTETFGLAFGRLAGEFQRTRVIPEIDAYRFSTYYKAAGTVVEVSLSAGEILSAIDAIDAQMDDDEVPEGASRILFVNPTVYKLMMNDPSLVKHITVDEGMSKALNKKIHAYNEHPIIKVPSTRFYTDIVLQDGVTSGQEAGGYLPKSDAKVIGFLMISKSAVLQLSKRRISRYWAPTREEMIASGADGVNPNCDAWKFDFRVYHDAWLLEEKLKGVAAATISQTTAAVTSIDISTDDEDVTIGGTAGTRTATISLGEVDYFKADADVVTTGGASTAVTWVSSNTEVAFVDTNGNIVLRSTGTVIITATSVYDPSKKATLTLTITA